VAEALAVTQISDNSLPFFGVAPAQILGRPIADWIDEDPIRVQSILAKPFSMPEFVSVLNKVLSKP
jgi:hypothetical protein